MLLYISGNSPIYVVRLMIIFQVFMIRKDCDRERGAEQEVVMMGEALVYCQEFSVMDIVVAFSVIEGLWVKSNGKVLSSFIFLCQDCTCGKCGGINLEKEGFGKVRLLEGGVVENDAD
jgi:hypothetical protein